MLVKRFRNCWRPAGSKPMPDGREFTLLRRHIAPRGQGRGSLHDAALTLFSAIIESSMTHGYSEIVIRNVIALRLIVVISGGAGSGKPTLANAVIAEIVETAPDDRILILDGHRRDAVRGRERRSAAYQRRDRHGAAAEEHHEVSP